MCTSSAHVFNKYLYVYNRRGCFLLLLGAAVTTVLCDQIVCFSVYVGHRKHKTKRVIQQFLALYFGDNIAVSVIDLGIELLMAAK